MTMAIILENYKDRLIDKTVDLYLKTFKAIQIVGPKWCGKTWTSMHHGNSIIRLTDIEKRNLAKLNPKLILSEDIPEVIDEWQLVPELWDAIRNECDLRTSKGNYILTGSTALLDKEEKSKIKHSGIGRIIKIKMFPMSTFELGKSLDYISLMDMYDEKEINKLVNPFDIYEITRLIINGGWPENLGLTTSEVDGLLAREYIKSLVENDINDNNNDAGFFFDSQKMIMVLKSLARNESSYAAETTILKDCFSFTNDEEQTLNKRTLSRYLDILEKLYIINNQEAYSTNYRSSSRVGKKAKRRFVDSSLAAALLGLTSEKLIDDLNTFGLLFESLVVRDLNVYMEYYRGHIYAFRDNLSNDEVDAIVEFSDGEYGAIEIKLGDNQIADAIKSLTKFNNKVEKKPKFLCVIVGIGSGLTRDPKSGVYIVPYNTLGMHFNI